MGRSGSLAFLSLLLLVPSLFFSPAAATALHADGVASFGGRRSLLQTLPPAIPPTTVATPPTPVAAPPTTVATPPTPVAAPPTPVVTPPTPAATPPATRATPPTGAIPPVPAGATPPTPVASPGPAPFIAPAPAPLGPTSRQRLNAAIAGGVVGSVVLIAIILIFCRCHCWRRQKRMPFQRLQMT